MKHLTFFSWRWLPSHRYLHQLVQQGYLSRVFHAELGFRHQSVGDRLFVDAILDDRPLDPTFAQGLRVQRVIDAAIEADRSGRRVELLGGAGSASPA